MKDKLKILLKNKYARILIAILLAVLLGLGLTSGRTLDRLDKISNMAGQYILNSVSKILGVEIPDADRFEENN